MYNVMCADKRYFQVCIRLIFCDINFITKDNFSVIKYLNFFYKNKRKLVNVLHF